jgi:hypothetical protein
MRRCNWCAVPLRWWQFRSCRMCAYYTRWDMTSPPCRKGARRNNASDRLGFARFQRG